MGKYRVAVIGHTGRGNYGHGIDTVWERFADRCEIVGVADADDAGRSQAAARLKAPRAFADYREMLDQTKPQIVGIGPRWIDEHLAMAVATAERGIHIFMEKPFCRTPEEADTIIAALEKRRVKLALAHQTRYSPKLQVIRELIQGGQLGEILEIRGRGKEDARGGAEDLWVLGSHIMNLIHFFGGAPQWCAAQVLQAGQSARREHVKSGNEGIGQLCGDQVNAMFGLDDGVTAYFGSRKNAPGGRFGIQIFGTKGIVEIATGFLPGAFYLADPSWSPGRSNAAWQPISSAGVARPETIQDEALAGNIAIVEDLLAAIEMDRDPECSAYEGRVTVEMICAIFDSHRQGKRVDFPLAYRRNPVEAF